MPETPSRRRNLTIQLGTETIRRARVLAARRGTSVSGLVERTLEELVARDDAYEEAMRGAIDALRRGIHLGGRIRASREELHER